MSTSVTLGKKANADCLSRRGGECTAQSIVKAMDNFMMAMNHMRDVVMVPSRLKDLDVELQFVDRSAPSSPNSSLVPVRPGQAQMAKSATVDLFTFYSMLDTVHQELVWGTDMEEEVSTDDDYSLDGSVDSEASSSSGFPPDSESHRLSCAFRQHLQGLFSVLHQMTEAANTLSKRYQDEVTPVLHTSMDLH